MRRQPRWAAAIEPLALARVAGHGFPKKFLQPFLPGYLARRPGVSQPPGPVRMRGLEVPAFDGVACKVRYWIQRPRCRQRFWRIARCLPPPPERRKYPQAPVFFVADVGGMNQEIAGKALRGDADLLQRRGDLIGHSLIRRLRDLIPERRAGMGLARQPGDNLCYWPFAQHQRRANRVEVVL